MQAIYSHLPQIAVAISFASGVLSVGVFLVVAALVGILPVISICWCIFVMYEKITKLIDERAQQ